jgi:hypothetical protein
MAFKMPIKNKSQNSRNQYFPCFLLDYGRICNREAQKVTDQQHWFLLFWKTCKFVRKLVNTIFSVLAYCPSWHAFIRITGTSTLQTKVEKIFRWFPSPR